MKNFTDNEIKKIFQLYFLTALNDMIKEKGIRKIVIDSPEKESIYYSQNIKYTKRTGKVVNIKKQNDTFAIFIKDSKTYKELINNDELVKLKNNLKMIPEQIKNKEKTLALYEFVKKAFTNPKRYKQIIEYIKEYIQNQKSEEKISEGLYKKIKEIDKELKGNIVSEILLNKLEIFEITSGIGKRIKLNEREEIRESNIFGTYFLNKLTGENRNIKKYKILDNNSIEIEYDNGTKEKRNIQEIEKPSLNINGINEKIKEIKEEIKQLKKVLKENNKLFEQLKDKYKKIAKQVNIDNVKIFTKDEIKNLLIEKIKNEINSNLDFDKLSYEEIIDIAMENEVLKNPYFYKPNEEEYLKFIRDTYIYQPARMGTLMLTELNGVSKKLKKPSTKRREVLEELEIPGIKYPLDKFSNISLKLENKTLKLIDKKDKKIVYEIKDIEQDTEEKINEILNQEFLKHLKLIGINDKNLKNLSELQKIHIGNLNDILLDKKYQKLSELKKELEKIENISENTTINNNNIEYNQN